MASSPLPLLILLAITPLLADAAGTSAAPTPAPGPRNLTAILVKGGQYNTLIRLLKETQIGSQIQSQLNNSFEGLTIFAPSDNAFNTLKPGTLNGLTAQEQVALVLFHVLPRFYTFEMFETASNPVRTQASGGDGPYTLNITSSNNQANVSTGVDQTRVNTALYDTFPLAVYPVDAVLLPYSLFGPKPPASAPVPQETTTPVAGSKAPSTPASKGPAAEAQTTPSAASSVGSRVGWWVVVVAGLVGVGSLW